MPRPLTRNDLIHDFGLIRRDIEAAQRLNTRALGRLEILEERLAFDVAAYQIQRAARRVAERDLVQRAAAVVIQRALGPRFRIKLLIFLSFLQVFLPSRF